MSDLKRLKILHFNDLHSDFFPKYIDGKKTGGISFLSNYIKNIKKNDDSVLLFYAGDALSGDINDSEYQGITTLAMLNSLGIDAMCPGNHEIDYGVPQLAVINQLASFPIVCANINIFMSNRKFLKPYTMIERGGLKILVIGIITTSISKNIETDKHTHMAVYVGDYYEDIEKLYTSNEYKEADMLIVLSHIGYEEDKILASKLRNDKFTIIIGGHSHTLLLSPEYVNNIPIVQTGIGSLRIGKFDIYYDEESKEIKNIEYDIEYLTEDNCQNNPEYDDYLNMLQEEIKTKYDNVACVLSRKLLNGDRNEESEFCDFFADVFNMICDTNLFLFDPGSTKAESIGPIIKYGDLKNCFPRSNELIKCVMSGKQLKQLFSYTVKYYGYTNNEDIFLQQTSRGIKVTFDSNTKELKSLLYEDKEIKDDDFLSVGMFEYSLINSLKKFSVNSKDIIKNRNIITRHPNSIEALYNFFLDYAKEKEVIEVNLNKRYIIDNNKSNF